MQKAQEEAQREAQLEAAARQQGSDTAGHLILLLEQLSEQDGLGQN